MVRLRGNDNWTPPPRLTICKARRTPTTTNPPFGYDDMPTRLEGEYRMTGDGRVREWHPRACSYDLATMWSWSSYKAELCMNSEWDVVTGLGLRVALKLALDNQLVT